MAAVVCSFGRFLKSPRGQSRGIRPSGTRGQSPATGTSVLPVAEKLNGRLAMQGLTWGAVNQFMLSEGGILDQVHDPHNLMTAAAVTSLVTLGTCVTQHEEESYFAWTPDAEMLNGRVAMVAFVCCALFNL